MKIETDQAEIVSGVRHSPDHRLAHRDHHPQHATGRTGPKSLPVEDVDGGEDKKKPVTRPRPGHADLAGAIKYDFPRRPLHSGARQRARNRRRGWPSARSPKRFWRSSESRS